MSSVVLTLYLYSYYLKIFGYVLPRYEFLRSKYPP